MSGAAGSPPQLDLEWVPGRYVICRLPAEAPLPAWASGRFVTITRTPHELSVISAWDGVPAEVRREGEA